MSKRGTLMRHGLHNNKFHTQNILHTYIPNYPFTTGEENFEVYLSDNYIIILIPLLKY